MHRLLHPNLTTFKVSNKKPEKVAYYEPESRTLSTEDTISKLSSECSSVLKFRLHPCRVDKNSYGNLEQKEIIQASRLSTNSHLAKRGLIGVVIEAWQHHHKLTLRPDDIWTALMVQFSFYVNANAEKLRSSFVSHQGKKNLGIEVESLTQVKTDMPKLVELFTRMIDSNLVDGTVKDWIIPNFSTTTNDDRMICGSVLMATMKSYFNYYMVAGCGIPSITLDGTVEDWQNIKNRISKFRRYDLNDWADMLDEILEQFVQAKKGKVDVTFWDKICHWDGEDMYKVPELSGWITAFCVFDKNGKWQGEAKEDQRWPIIHYNGADGYVTVDIVLLDLLTKRVLNTTLYAGHLGHEIVDNGFGLQPKVGWMLALVGQKEMKATDLAELNRETTDVAFLKRKKTAKTLAEKSEKTLKPAKRRRRNELELLLDMQ